MPHKRETFEEKLGFEETYFWNWCISGIRHVRKLRNSNYNDKPIIPCNEFVRYVFSREAIVTLSSSI
jgi:hypothetical protein